MLEVLPGSLLVLNVNREHCEALKAQDTNSHGYRSSEVSAFISIVSSTSMSVLLDLWSGTNTLYCTIQRCLSTAVVQTQ